jgi:hypothetical protein
MDSFTIFLDESGWADLNAVKQSPYYTVCGVVIKENCREGIKKGLEKIKEKYFGSKSYVLHLVRLRRDLASKHKQLSDFAIDLERFLKSHNFFLLIAVVDKAKAIKYSWANKTVYERIYKDVIGNLIKFLKARKSVGHIYAEASTVHQDIFIYNNFFSYIANGLPSLSITPEDVKTHLTSLTYVTKLNNDAEQQIADLFGYCGTLQIKMNNKEIELSSLDEIDQVLFKIMQSKYFQVDPSRVIKPIKKRLYKSIIPFSVLP